MPPRLALAPLSYEEINLAVRHIVEKASASRRFTCCPRLERLRRSYVHPTPMTWSGWKRIGLCFSSFNGAVPMKDNKKTDAGFRQRKAVLARHIPARAIDRLLGNLMGSVPRAQCARDDMVDALVCGVVARLDAEERDCLPPGGQEFDEVGLPMRICYPIPPASH